MLPLFTRAASAQEQRIPPVLADDFSAPRLQAHWIWGNHPDNHTVAQNGALTLRSLGKTSGWIHTRDKFSLRERLVQIKMTQPNGDGALGISPTVTSASPVAFSAEQNFYRFYTARDDLSGPYRLYVQWGKAGFVEGLEVAPEIEVVANSYLRLLVREGVINFQYSVDGESWQTVYAETFALPGHSLNDRFYIELAAGYTQRNGDWTVDDFVLRAHDEAASSGAIKEKIVLSDPLRDRTSATRVGGKFAAEGGWQAVAREDMLVYDLGRYIENGVLELTVRNFYPPEQNSAERHHFLAMFRNPWGNHHSVETQETFWDLHTGAMYAPGVKLQSSTNYADEQATIVKNLWNKEESYKLRVTWNGKEVQYFRNGALQARHLHEGAMQLRYLFLGRDYTVSGDLITNFMGNQYPAYTGPIFSDLTVKANIAAHDATPLLVENLSLASLYANAARLQWSTSEPAQCWVEYGLVAAQAQKTSLLGPPAQNFSAVLPNLAANQTYSYRIIAEDDAGNRMITPSATFTTNKSGLYLFHPSADTYVEKNNIYGERRSLGNFGWMNLLASEGRECYLRFEVAEVNGEVAHAALRLHGRQSGKGGGKLRALRAPWEEKKVVWQTKPLAEESDLGYIDAVLENEWQGVALHEAVTGNGVYDFALLGMGETVSFDARESPNYQPELVIALREKDGTPPLLTEAAVSEVTPHSAVLTWKTSEPATAIVEYGLDENYERGVADSSDFSFVHRVTLRKLLPYKKYHCRVRSFDAAGNYSVATELQFETLPARVERVALHEIFEAHFPAKNAGATPYVNGPELLLTFTGTTGAALDKTVTVAGFWDGKEAYLVRFAPPASGTWAWQAQSSDAGLEGQRGTLTCEGNLPETHAALRGPVRRSQIFPTALTQTDSLPFFLLGAQLQAGLKISLSDFQKYVAARVELGFNFLQMPAWETAGVEESEAAFFAQDGDRLNPDYWRQLDERLAFANTQGLVVGLKLLPKGAASYFNHAEQVQRFVRYVVRRYAAFNVVWMLDELPVGEAFALEGILRAISENEAQPHAVVLSREHVARTEAVLMLERSGENNLRAVGERRLAIRPLAVAINKSAAEELRQRVWAIVMQGEFPLLMEEMPQTLTEEILYPANLNFVSTLKDFWANDIHHAVPWWKFTRFESPAAERWLAGKPGEAYAIYSGAQKDFKIDLSEIKGEIRGEWYNTRTGRWSTAFSGTGNRNFPLKPPGAGFIAFLWAYGN